MSSHLSALANTSTLRFIAEECSLFISDKPLSKDVPPKLRQDYVCVVDFGLFEVSLRTNDKVCDILNFTFKFLIIYFFSRQKVRLPTLL